jgi:hypothetical protein
LPLRVTKLTEPTPLARAAFGLLDRACSQPVGLVQFCPFLGNRRGL